MGTIRGFIELRERYYEHGAWRYAHEKIEGDLLAQLDQDNARVYAVANGGRILYVKQTPDGWWALNAEESRRFAAVANARRSQLQAAT